MSQRAADPGAHADLVRLRRDKAEIKTLLGQVIGEHRLARGFALLISMPGVGLTLFEVTVPNMATISTQPQRLSSCTRQPRFEATFQPTA